ncbi:MAG: tetratricopeptide repeat protein [Parachlamydiales bacterium]
MEPITAQAYHQLIVHLRGRGDLPLPLPHLLGQAAGERWRSPPTHQINSDQLLFYHLALHLVPSAKISLLPDPAVLMLIWQGAEGDTKSQIEVAWRYLLGDRLPRDHSLALKWFSTAAERDPDGVAYQGMCFEMGIGCKPDSSTALNLYEKAAKQGSPAGLRQLGEWYRSKGDREQAVSYYTEAHKQGDLLSLVQLAYCKRFWYGGDEPLEATAFSLLSKEAEKGRPHIESELAMCYWGGIGTAPNLSKAIDLFASAAYKGWDPAYVPLGHCLEERESPQDLQAAYLWFERAGAQGDCNGLYAQGLCLFHGKGVQQDCKAAVTLFSRSVEMGKREAATMLGIAYDQGRGVEQNFEIAFSFFLTGAKAGSAASQNNLSNCYFDGRGTKKNPAEGFYWVQKAAEGGDAEGLSNLGLCYEKGEGTTKDLAKATICFHESAKRGSRNGKFYLGRALFREGKWKEAGSWLLPLDFKGDSEALSLLEQVYSKLEK